MAAMTRKPFGRTGVDVATVGQGTWDIPESGARLDEAKRALRRGVELGMTHVDTAEMYGSGRVEEIVGDALAGLPRAELFIATKVLPGNASYEGTLAAAERSLRRLRCDYLDLFLLHWPGPHPLDETMRALETLVGRGLVRFVGVSNFDTGAMLEAASYLRSVPLTCNQVLYHLCERGIERELMPAAERAGVAVVAYTPFGRGAALTHSRGMAALERIAAKHAATPRQVTLAFLTRRPEAFAIPKASRVPHVEENAGAAGLVLDESDVEEIDRAFPIGAAGPLATL